MRRRLIPILIAAFFATAFAMATNAARANGPTMKLDEPLNPVQMQQEAVSPSNKTVRYAQSLLKQTGHLDSEVDGVMGNRTVKALKNFQQSEGLESSGRIDNLTLKRLKEKARKTKQAQEEVH